MRTCSASRCVRSRKTWVDPVLLRSVLGDGDDVVRFAGKFEQLTAPATAKGIEDTAFYRYGRLLALNDVGGDPGRFGIDVDRFHAGSLEREERFPLNLLTTMTHDAKRSADVRATIGALSVIADDWVAEAEHGGFER